jgi:hypothetical protein
MLITKHFVFLHYARTGGVFIRRACRDHLPADWLISEPEETHAHVADIPEQYANLPTVCFIRNPWDWYVSWYEFNLQYWAPETGRQPPQRPTNFWTTLFGQGQNDFGQMVFNSCTRDEGNRAWEIAMREWDVDLFSAIFFLMTGRAPSPPSKGSSLESAFAAGRQVEVGRYESLREDFLDFLGRHEIPAPQAFLDVIRKGPARHASMRRPYREYYDDELRDLVGYKARTVIAEQGYSF